MRYDPAQVVCLFGSVQEVVARRERMSPCENVVRYCSGQAGLSIGAPKGGSCFAQTGPVAM